MTRDELIQYLGERERHFAAVEKQAAAAGEQYMIDVASCAQVQLRWLKRRIINGRHPLHAGAGIVTVVGSILGSMIDAFMAGDDKVKAVNSLTLRFMHLVIAPQDPATAADLARVLQNGVPLKDAETRQ